PLHHYRLGKVLDEVLDPGTIVIGDGGDVVAAVSRVLRIHRPGHWLDPGPFGCLGIGPPYALGVKAAKPDKQVVVVAGDGAFGLAPAVERALASGEPAIVNVMLDPQAMAGHAYRGM